MTTRRDATGTSASVSFTGLYIGAAALSAVAGLVFPLLGDLQDTYGLPTWGLGTIAGVAFLTGVASQLLLAPLADRGYAQRLLVGGLLLASAGCALFAAGSTLAVFVFARMLTGAGAGMFLPAARAVCATADPDHAGARLGRLASIELAGFIAGPIAAVILAGAFGLKAPFVVFGVGVLVMLVPLTLRPLPRLVTTGESSRPSLALLRRRDAVVAVLLGLGLFLPVGVYDALWDRYLQDRGASEALIAISFAIYGAPFVALAGLGGRLVDRGNDPVRTSVRMLMLIGPLTVLYGMLPSTILILVLGAIEGALQALAVPAAQAAMARACPPGRAAAGQGLVGATQQTGAALMAFAAAPIYGAWGSVAVFAIAGAGIVLLGLAASALSSPSSSRSTASPN